MELRSETLNKNIEAFLFMTDKKKSFILHLDSLAILDEMTFEQKGILFDAIYKYQLGVEVELDFGIKMAFATFKNQFNRDNEKYNSFVIKQKGNGKMGGRPKKLSEPTETQKTQAFSDKPKKAYNDNVSDNDSVSINVNTLDLLNTKSELELTFDSYLEMRKQIKKPAPPHAVNLIKKKLVQMTNNNESDMCDLLNQSIVNSWVDIYPIKNTFVKKDKPTMRTTNEVFDEISRKIKSGEIDTTIYTIL